MHKLIALGRRRYSSFLGNKERHPSPMFGVSKLETLFLFVDHENDRVRILRDIESNLDYSHDQIIIRYRHTYVDRLVMETKGNTLLPDEMNSWEYASALPCHQETSKRRLDGRKISNSVHTRWICMPWERDRLLRSREVGICVYDDGCTLGCLCEDDVFGCSETCPCESLEKSCSVNHNLNVGFRAVGVRAETIRNIDKEDCISNQLQVIATYSRRRCTGHAEAHAMAATLYESTWKVSRLGHRTEISLEKGTLGK